MKSRFIKRRVKVKPNALDECKKAIREFIEYICANEPDTRMSLALNENNDPTEFLHVFILENEAASDRHSNSDGVERFASILYPNCVAPVEFRESAWVASN